MGRPKGSKNKVKRSGSIGRGPGRPAAKRRGRPPLAKRGRPPGRPKMAVRRGRPAATYKVMLPTSQPAGFSFNPIDWMPLIMAAVDLVKLIHAVIAKENGVGTTPVTSASPRTSESFAKTVAAKAESNAEPIFKGAKKRGRPKKEAQSMVAGVPVPAEVQDEMELEDPLDDGSDEFENELEEDPLDDDLGDAEESVDADSVL